ncbi:YidB family protein [uncultured Enterovirga sp.]|uniref:YidB family protein n=1 Tax=uncultured Enterovirga sp. TaxID=2026352 RepID=UPI0035C9B74B
MGLLDQVLGQVIGNMAGGQADRSRPQPGAGAGPMGGGLGDLLGGAAGKYSPLVMALLSLLASKHMNSGAGGSGSVLQDVFGKITGQGGAAAETVRRRYDAPDDDARMGLEPFDDELSEDEEQPRYAPQRRGGGGQGDSGFLNSIGSLLDGPGGSAASGGGTGRQGGFGSLVGTGLDGLADRFSQNGQGGAMNSWIGPGQNQAIAPHELDQALGSDTVEELSRQTGLERDDLLSQLSHALPQVVDGLTPQGRLPSPDEHRGWI